MEIFNDLSETLAGLDERIDAMEQSQSVYHEDSQVLWWMLSKWSEISNCSLNNIDKRSGCLLIGWEAANIIEIFPGPYSMEHQYTICCYQGVILLTSYLRDLIHSLLLKNAHLVCAHHQCSRMVK